MYYQEGRPMAMPVKVSDGLLVAAREEAKLARRSTTAQIEYWASIGRAVEMLVAHSELLALKRAGDLLSPVFSSVRRDEVHRLLSELVASPGEREKVLRLIHAGGGPVYESDPDHPGQVVEVSPDGARGPVEVAAGDARQAVEMPAARARHGRIKRRRVVPAKRAPR
jgi:ParD-like antitoxin of type II ParDE toxin-antitoxin system